MRITKALTLVSSLFFLTSCLIRQGIALTVENAPEHLDLSKFAENSMNGFIDGSDVSFRIYPNAYVGGKVFSDDIKGKCTLTVKYTDGKRDALFNIIWSEPKTIQNVPLAYCRHNDMEGPEEMDFLGGSFMFGGDSSQRKVSIYNVTVTEISGHMMP